MKRRSAWWKRMLLVGSLTAGIILSGCGGTVQYYPMPSWPAYDLSGQPSTVGSETAQPGTTPGNTAQTPNEKPEGGTAPAAPADRELNGSEIVTCRNEILQLLNQKRTGTKFMMPQSLNNAADERVRDIVAGQSTDMIILLKKYDACETSGRVIITESSFAVSGIEPAQIVAQWMSRESDKSKITQGTYRQVGIGYTYANSRSYWILLFLV